MSAHVVSVNTGQVKVERWAGSLGRTAIDKRPVDGPVRVGFLGVEGDQIADTKHHGGPDRAVYAFAREDLDFWGGQLGREVPPGLFGENITTSGIDVNEAILGVSGFDDTAWVKRFAAVGRPGPYLRVVEEGTVQAGDPLAVEHRPDHGVTVSSMFRALTTDRSRVKRHEYLPLGSHLF